MKLYRLTFYDIPADRTYSQEFTCRFRFEAVDKAKEIIDNYENLIDRVSVQLVEIGEVIDMSH